MCLVVCGVPIYSKLMRIFVGGHFWSHDHRHRRRVVVARLLYVKEKKIFIVA